MTRSPRPFSLGVSGSFFALGQASSINWRTHVLFLFPALSTTLFFDSARLGGTVLEWALITVVGVLATVLVVESLSQLLRKQEWPASRPLVAVLILLTAGLARGVVIYLSGNWLGIVGPGDLVFRLIGGPAFVLVAYLFFNQIIASYLEGRALAGQLAVQKEELRTARDNFDSELERLYALEKNKVGDLLTPAIWELGKHLGDAKLSKDASAAIASLRSINDQVVRPLSKDIATLKQNPEIAKVLERTEKPGRFVLPRRVPLGELLPVGILGLFLLVVGLSSQVVQVSFSQALINTGVLSGILILEVLAISALLYRVQVAPLFGLALSIVIGIVVGQSVVLIRLLPFVSASDNIVEQTSIFFGLSLPAIFILSLVQRQRLEFFASLRQSLEEMKVLTSKLRSQAWLNQKLLATKLHGTLQAALYSSAIRLSENQNPTAEDFEKVERDVQKAFAEIEDKDYLEGQSAREVLEDMQELWSGTCEISLDIQDEVASLLTEQVGLARCVVEVCREAITNATKHGQAKHIQLRMTRGNGLIHLEIENDGEMISSPESGFGTTLIDQLTYVNSLENLGDKVVFRAKIAVLG